MRSHPTLNVEDITPDPELVRQLPSSLALYYLALPLGREDGQVSVALAHPENTTALAVLSRWLDGAVIPVRGAAGAIRAALQRLQPAQALPDAAVVGWSADRTWTPVVAAWTEFLGAALGAPTALHEAAPDAPADLAVPPAPYRLLVLSLCPPLAAETLCSQATAPLLILRDPGIYPVRRILVALRGFSSDDHTLAFVAALAQQTRAGVTLLPLYLSPQDSPEQGALRECLRRFEAGGMQTTLKLRHGDQVAQIVDEAGAGGYDLLVLAAEGVGEFVGRVLAELDRRPGIARAPMLVLKPVYF